MEKREAVLHLLDLLGTYPALRRLVAQRCNQPRDPRKGITVGALRSAGGAELAGCLLARDDATAVAAAAAVRNALAESPSSVTQGHARAEALGPAGQEGPARAGATRGGTGRPR